MHCRFPYICVTWLVLAGLGRLAAEELIEFGENGFTRGKQPG